MTLASFFAGAAEKRVVPKHEKLPLRPLLNGAGVTIRGSKKAFNQRLSISSATQAAQRMP